VLRFTPLLAEPARPSRHAVGFRWWAEETDVRVAGGVTSPVRSTSPARSLTCSSPYAGMPRLPASCSGGRSGTPRSLPVEVVTGHTPAHPLVLGELAPAAWHRTDQYANNRVEAGHGRLKARLGRMCGLKQDRSARVSIARGMPSYRTFGAATTSWRSRSRQAGEWRLCSTSWPWRSDSGTSGDSARREPTECNSAAWMVCGFRGGSGSRFPLRLPWRHQG
jgi:hypothetical protein